MTPDLSARHQALVDELKCMGSIRTPLVEAAFRAVPRHLFVPDAPPEEVYSDRPIVTKHDDQRRPLSSSSQPSLMALMLEELELEPAHSVLEIGTGTGYNAALMAHIVGKSGRVFSIDIDEEICAKARERLAGASFEQVKVVCADGALGYSDASPYDGIIVTVGAPDIASSWRQQLVPGGRLVVPLKILGTQYSIAFEKREDHLASHSVTHCGFIGLRGALAEASGLEFAPPSFFPWLDEAKRTAKDWQVGVEATLEEAQGSLLLWVALHEPGICLVQEVLDGQNKCVMVIWTCTDRKPWANGVSCGNTAGLVLRAGGAVDTRQIHSSDRLRMVRMDRSCAVSVRQFGPEESLACRLMKHVKAWDDAGRPSCHDLRIRVYPKEVQYRPCEGEFVVKNEFSQLVIEWPFPAAHVLRESR